MAKREKFHILKGILKLGLHQHLDGYSARMRKDIIDDIQLFLQESPDEVKLHLLDTFLSYVEELER